MIYWGTQDTSFAAQQRAVKHDLCSSLKIKALITNKLLQQVGVMHARWTTCEKSIIKDSSSAIANCFNYIPKRIISKLAQEELQN